MAPDDALRRRLPEAGRFLPHDRIRPFDQAGHRLAEHGAVIGEGPADRQGDASLPTTIPGIDRRAASATVIGPGPDVPVFPGPGHCAAWAGPAPGNDGSAGKRRPGWVRKGNQALRAPMIECAQAAARSEGRRFRGRHEALTVRRGHRRVTVAVANRVPRIMWGMPSTGERRAAHAAAPGNTGGGG